MWVVTQQVWIAILADKKIIEKPSCFIIILKISIFLYFYYDDFHFTVSFGFHCEATKLSIAHVLCHCNAWTLYILSKTLCSSFNRAACLKI